MRRLILACSVALIVCLGPAAPASALDIDLNLSVGMDFEGEFDVEAVTRDAETGYSLGLELMFDVPIVELGVGFEYGFERDCDCALDDYDVEYSLVYAVGRLNLIGPVYAAARLGYSDLSGFDELADVSLDGGESWSVGGGVKLFGKFRVEALLNNFSGDIGGVDFDYETWSLRALVTF